MTTLPKDIVLFLLDFLKYSLKVELLCCCKEWYFSVLKTKIRTLRICRDYESWAKRLTRIIVFPFNQLGLSMEYGWNENIISLLSGTDYCLRQLVCTEGQFLKILKSTDKLKVKDLRIDLAESSPKRAIDFSKVTDCESLSLEYIYLATIPHLSSVTALSLGYTNLQFNLPLLMKYATHLQRLTLHGCTISDVSMLGSIPYLELDNCTDLVDISALNNNDHVVVRFCVIQDYSRSFAYSRKIEIMVEGLGFATDYTFDTSRWLKVEDLSLINSEYENTLHFQGSNQLPKTVKRCILSGLFVSAIDFTLTSDHVLNELVLEDNSIITNLDKYRLEKVAIITCGELYALQSLQGLGRGRNRKIVIRNCPRIQNFSSLDHLPLVEISGCRGFTDHSQLGSVPHLIIA